MQLIGVISDTHGLIRPEALDAFIDTDLIIHAGDIGSPEVIERLRTIAPVVAVRGNVDRGEWARSIPKTETLEVAGLLFYVVHDINELDLDPTVAGLSLVIAGHSHQPSYKRQKGVLIVNPGSAGPSRFNLPATVALIHIKERDLEPEIIELMNSTQKGRRLCS